VTFVPPVPPEEVVASASGHDVGIINIWPENESHRWTGSNKLFDYMGAGLAELVTNLDFTRRIVETEQIGIVFDPPDVDQIAESLAWLIENPDEVARMKRNAVAAAPRYTWDAQAETLYAVYEQALGRLRATPQQATTVRRTHVRVGYTGNLNHQNARVWLQEMAGRGVEPVAMTEERPTWDVEWAPLVIKAPPVRGLGLGRLGIARMMGKACADARIDLLHSHEVRLEAFWARSSGFHPGWSPVGGATCCASPRSRLAIGSR
jgi:hypothetical protein